MKTKLLLIVMLFVLAVSVNAQTQAESIDVKPFKIGAGAMIGLPVGDASQVFSLAYGFDLMGEYTVAGSTAITFSAGYADWSLKKSYKDLFNYAGASVPNTGMIPVLVGAKQFFDDQFYGNFQIGLTFYTESGYGNEFTYAPAIGYQVSDKFDISLRYQAISGGGDAFLGFRAGFLF